MKRLYDFQIKYTVSINISRNVFNQLSFCFSLPFCACIPCCIDSFNTVTHKCPQCKAFLGRYKGGM